MPSFEAKHAKVHLAGINRSLDKRKKASLSPDQQPADPLEEFHSGKFVEWQSRQTRLNFSRPLIVSWIQLDPGNRWLFAGVFRTKGKPKDLGKSKRLRYRYDMDAEKKTENLVGRLIVTFTRTGRSSYRLAETMLDHMTVSELLPTRHKSRPFPGYVHFTLTRAELLRIVKYDIESWRVGLKSVAGIYLITDSSDQQMYVGSATGKQGIWQRWASYAEHPDGGNKLLKALLKKQGVEHARHFQYAILETADTKATRAEILEREYHWKNVLGTRAIGLNAN